MNTDNNTDKVDGTEREHHHHSSSESGEHRHHHHSSSESGEHHHHHHSSSESGEHHHHSSSSSDSGSSRGSSDSGGEHHHHHSHKSREKERKANSKHRVGLFERRYLPSVKKRKIIAKWLYFFLWVAVIIVFATLAFVTIFNIE